MGMYYVNSEWAAWSTSKSQQEALMSEVFFFAITYLVITDRLNRNWSHSWWNRAWLISNLPRHCVRKGWQWPHLSTYSHLWLKIHSTSTPNLRGLPNTGSHKMYRVPIKQDTWSPPSKSISLSSCMKLFRSQQRTILLFMAAFNMCGCGAEWGCEWAWLNR